jgi:two-component system response regulator HydG
MNAAWEAEVSSPHTQMLIVDADPQMCSACGEMAASLGFSVRTTGDLEIASDILRGELVEVLLLNLPWGTTRGLDLISEVKLLHPNIGIVAMTGSTSVNNAVEALRRGASDYLTKPFTVDDLCEALHRTMCNLRPQLDDEWRNSWKSLMQGKEGVVARSIKMERIFRVISKVGQTRTGVLIVGESGTGKEMVARALHRVGNMSRGPFLPIDCSSIVPTLVEAELFGYVKGAFTGAFRDKQGLLASAQGGTVFLDEIGELSLDVQAKLLRALQLKEVRPIGSKQTIHFDARVVAATNRDLDVMVDAGTFRKDLFYRLSVVTLRLPPLRHRKEDIPLLASHFLQKLQPKVGTARILGADAMRCMMNYDWPGNVRELENALARADALADGAVIETKDLPTQMQQLVQKPPKVPKQKSPFPAGSSLGIRSLESVEREAIEQALVATSGDRLKAAKLLGIGKTTLYRKLHEYGAAD